MRSAWLARLAVVLMVSGFLLPSAAGIASAQTSTTTGATPLDAGSDSPSVGQANQVTPAPRASLPDIENEVMCTVCGTLLALATESPQANRERDLIRSLIAKGETKEQIEDRLVQEFGPNVLATPSTAGFDLAAWVVPGLAVIAAAIGIFLGLRRWRRETDEREDSSPAPLPLSDEDAKRLDADFGKYEL